MANRSAIDTIRGYFYQFDYSIKRLLELENENDTVVVEGIEDIDIKSATEETAVQCKYYSKTEYNHSVIGKPIRMMLTHFKSVKKGKNKKVNYHLYGYYKSGHEKLVNPITVTFLKETFLTYTKEKVKYKHHEILGFSEADLHDFLSLLHININAVDYDSQLDSVLKLLENQFNCSRFEAEHYYYNSALDVLRNLSIEEDIENRTITKKKFLKLINNQKILFNMLFIRYKGKKRYLKELRQHLFSTLNSSPFERFFVIQVPDENYDRVDLKELLMIISKKYSKLSKRESRPFCPYVCLYNMENQELIKLKNDLYNEGFKFKDGYDFQGAEFNPSSLIMEANYYNDVRLKVLSNYPQMELTLKLISKTKEIYQFYISNPLIKRKFENIKQINIQIEELTDIREVI
ncbi:DUF4297 family anti-phage-associated protein [Oceanobacillus salinisoli]|uniref:DUF4297 family anti-phage-associated protein n=1 Tax=Oceanobacillus salinisoli TaxID=2678611 RepID=UPI0012E2E24F|nr:DUF4297 family anti-phage-associated protein [Oceanobacillus salinisoli]